ncbi:MAG TPA: hypothetical protein VMQ17_25700 [Candidatus Sulfotelmatobacter sp.]|jgi:hypothetical protein|nr:hypothetical protein [Candidatus Sulfotelmatobacter sp.]
MADEQQNEGDTIRRVNGNRLVIDITFTYGVYGMVCWADSRQTVPHASKVPLRY